MTEKECRIGLPELYEMALSRDPRKAEKLRTLWMNGHISNEKIVFGL